MATLKKIRRFISSMPFAIGLLVLLAAACALSSLVTQGQTYAWYAARYSERTAALILTLRLDDAFHSWWFVLITAFLCLNLLLCNVTRLGQLIRRTRAEGEPPSAGTAADVEARGLTSPDAVFAKLGMGKPVSYRTADGHEARFAARNRAGLWGAWVCHLGVLLLIAGFALGQMTQRQWAVYGVPGQTRMIGDTGYALTIDDFRVELREDDTVEQYTADIAVGNGEAVELATISVNNPATLFGMKFYQNSTGWAAAVNVEKDGVPLQREVVCAGEYLRVSDKPDLVIYLNAFYPDYVFTPGVGPATASGQLNNPAYLYSVYFEDRMLGMNALMADEELTIDEYTVTFSDPQTYTLIQVKRDRFTYLALVGGLITLLGLVLAFYVQPRSVWAVRQSDGGWTVYGASRKGGALFRERFEAGVREAPTLPSAPEADEPRAADEPDAE